MRRNAIARRGAELRQLRVQREIELGQLPQLTEQLLELLIRDVAKLARRLPRSVGEESARKALLRRTAGDAAAALCLATRAAGRAPITRLQGWKPCLCSPTGFLVVTGEPRSRL
jgi:hypothetical protein